MLFSRVRYVSLFFGCCAMFGCGTSSTVNDVDPRDAATDEPSCLDTCAPQPDGWNGPALLRSGTKMDVLHCPADAPNVVYKGNADLVATNECTACTCEASTGTCGLMTTVTFYLSDVACMPSPIVYSYDPPPNWDGSCVNDGPIAKDMYNTIKIGKHPLTDDKCAPSTPVPDVDAPSPDWETYAWACGSEGSPECDGKTCIPKDRTADGFVTCVHREGVHVCPQDYPVQQVFYDGFDDQRACSACECGPPVGSDCAGSLRLYEDTECQDSTMILPTGASGNGGACLLGPNPAESTWWYPIGSKSAGPVEYWPGTCPASGGEPVGEAVPTGPTTFCCRDGS